MKKLTTFDLSDRVRAGMIKSLLEQEGIACLLKNDHLLSGLGEIPFVEVFPELWVIDDEMYPRAKLLVDSWLKENLQDEDSWVCTRCGELLEGQFGACWKCGEEKA